MNQLTLPMSLEDMIPKNHVVRVANTFIGQMSLDSLLDKYQGGGPSYYHPEMMLKVLMYAYTQKVWSSRQIAKALRENVNFMWLAGSNKPDFRTINRFRLSMKDVIDEVFQALMNYLLERKLILLETYFMDGTKIEANASKYSFVWKKGTEKNQDKLRQKVSKLLEEIDNANELENGIYGDKDLAELGEDAIDDPDALEKLVQNLNEKLANKSKSKRDKSVRITRKAVRTLEKDCLPRAKKYKFVLGTIGNQRNSMSKTDPDATFMRMKDDHMNNGQLKPGYNVQIGTENQFVVGFSLHQRPGDTCCLREHIERVKNIYGKHPEKVVADAGYGSEENYEYLEEKKIQSYVKYNMFHKEQKQKFTKDAFKKENMPYDEETDTFTCPNGKELTFSFIKKSKNGNGYISEVRVYQCKECTNCPYVDKCLKGKVQHGRRIEINRRLNELRAKSRENLMSEAGIALRKRRCIEPEYVFGRLKWCWGFKRFLLRGIEKTKLEWGLLCIAHNLTKLAALGVTK